MKRIGIFLAEFKSASGNTVSAFRSDLLTYLRQFDVDIIAIPLDFQNDPQEEFNRIKRTIHSCQGFIFPGGSSIHDIDKIIVKHLYLEDKPLLGICLGMQIMSTTFNGIIMPLTNNDHQSKLDYVHEINLKPSSKLAHILNTNSLIVNSRHSEHITETDLEVVAYASDGTIEAVEDSHKKFFIGIQWHPESIKKDPYSYKLFHSFIDTIKEF